MALFTIDTGQGSAEVEMDRDELTFADAIEVEQLAGMSIYDAPYGGRKLPMKLLVAIAYVGIRKTYPAFSFDDAKRLSMSKLVLVEPKAPAAFEAGPTGGESGPSPS
jgi:hypothetical protein